MAATYRTEQGQQESGRRATVEDLYKVKEKAELVGGQLKIMDGTGHMPSRAAAAIYRALYDYERRTRSGFAYTDNMVFLVELPNRQSFSPDAAYYVGQPAGMKFLQGAPVLAVEVRSENDYGRTPEREMRDKRAHYFAAGTLVVWDVDLLNDDVVRVFRNGNADAPDAIYRRGELAEAEPALQGWRFSVDELFD